MRGVSLRSTSSGSSVSESSTSASTGIAPVAMTAFAVAFHVYAGNDHLVARPHPGADEAADQRGRAGVDAERVTGADVRSELSLEVRDLVRSVADAVVAEDVLAAEDAGDRLDFLLVDLHAAREHRPLRTAPRSRAAVDGEAQVEVGLGHRAILDMPCRACNRAQIPMRWPFLPSSTRSRAAVTSAFVASSGTATSQNAPPGVQSCGAVRMTRTVVRSAARALANASSSSSMVSTSSARQPRARACDAQSTGAYPRCTSSSMFPYGGPALADLQAVDDGVPPVVAEHDDQLVAGEVRAVELGVEHEVRPVSDERDDLARCAPHSGSPGARDLVPHRRVAVLAVERADSFREPVDVHLAREPACGGQREILRARESIDRTDDLRVRRDIACVRRRGTCGDERAERRLLVLASRLPRLVGLPAGERVRQLRKAFARVCDEREREVLRRIEAGDVESDDACGLAEHGPRAGREVLQPRPDREHDVGLGRQPVRLVAARHADGPDPRRVVRDEARLPGHRLHHREAMALGERAQRILGERVVDASAGDDERALCVAERGGRLLELRAIGPRPAKLVHPGLEKRSRVVPGLGLDVLREPDECRATVRGVEHRLDRERQALRNLLRRHDAVPVARHRAECVVDRGRRRAEVLDLLQHRVGNPALERVAREDQEGQPIGHCRCSRRDHVRRPRPDRRGRDHDLPAPSSLRERDGRKGHSLLVLAAIHRQLVGCLPKCVPEAEHVPVSEDREHAGKERRLCLRPRSSAGQRESERSPGPPSVARSSSKALRAGERHPRIEPRATATSPGSTRVADRRRTRTCVPEPVLP